MAFTPHTLVTFGGTLVETTSFDEIWECGVRGFNMPAANIPVDPSQLQNLVDDIATRTTGNLADWFVAASSFMGGDARMTFVKAVNVGADGKYTSAPARHEFTPAIAGGSAQTMPSFCSVALSWTTGIRFGKARMGRIYPPNFGVPSANGAIIQGTAQSALVDSGIGLIGTLSSAGAEFEFQPQVVSKSGPHHKITGVRVGNVVDVQRRRRNAVRETYVERPVVVP